MDKTIKTREVIKDIKVLDKRQAGLAAVRDVHAKVKDVAENRDSSEQQHSNGSDYAQTKAEQAIKECTNVARKTVTGSATKTMGKIVDAKNARQAAKPAQSAINAAHKQAAMKTATHTSATAKQTTAAASKKAADSATNATNTAKKSVRHGAKKTLKTTTKSVKTAKVTAGKAIKTSRQVAQSARASAKATQVAARNAARAARVASKAIISASKAAIRGIMTFVKLAVAAVRSLVAAIAAGGWVAVAVILIICLVGLIASSAFGIFFAGGDMGDGNPTLREVVATVNQEHQSRIERIRTDNPHDELMLTGQRSTWKEVLTIYSIKATSNSDSQAGAITLDARHLQMLKEIYWDMNAISHRIEDRQYTEIVSAEQDDGSVIEQTQVYTRRTLYITQSAKTAAEMALAYGFSSHQRQMLTEMLSTRYASAWQSVLYGTHTGSGNIVEVAASQLGNPGGQPFWSWYGYSARVEWCACFVSWCANECGYIESGIIPKHSYCQTGINWFRDAGCWQASNSGYEPKPGDIIYFDWGDGGDSDHVGIVERTEGGYVYTIEGNSSDAVNRNSYRLSSPVIIGYGTPNY